MVGVLMQNMMHHDAMGGADACPQAVKNDDDDDSDDDDGDDDDSDDDDGDDDYDGNWPFCPSLLNEWSVGVA